MTEILDITKDWIQVFASEPGMLERASAKINSGALDSDLDPNVAAKIAAVSVLEDIAAQARGTLMGWQVEEVNNLSHF